MFKLQVGIALCRQHKQALRQSAIALLLVSSLTACAATEQADRSPSSSASVSSSPRVIGLPSASTSPRASTSSSPSASASSSAGTTALPSGSALAGATATSPALEETAAVGATAPLAATAPVEATAAVDETAPVEATTGITSTDVTAANILADPASFIDQPVLINDIANQTLSSNAFLVGDQPGLPVISATEDVAVNPEDQLSITGVVRQFNLVEVEQELGYDLDDNLYAQYEGQLVVIADQVEGATGVVAATLQATGTAQVASDTITLDQLTNNPDAYIGGLVQTEGSVDEQINGRALRLTNGVTDTLVLGVDENTLSAVESGEDAQIVGEVRRFDPAQIESELGVDLDDEQVAEYTGRPVIIANQAQPTTPISDPALVIDATDRAALIGRQVELENVQVQRVPGNVTFWVGPDDQIQQVVVVLDEQSNPEGRYNVEPGQTLNIIGEIREFPGLDEFKSQFEITADNDDELAEQEIYIFAQQIDVIDQ